MRRGNEACQDPALKVHDLWTWSFCWSLQIFSECKTLTISQILICKPEKKFPLTTKNEQNLKLWPSQYASFSLGLKKTHILGCTFKVMYNFSKRKQTCFGASIASSKSSGCSKGNFGKGLGVRVGPPALSPEQQCTCSCPNIRRKQKTVW